MIDVRIRSMCSWRVRCKGMFPVAELRDPKTDAITRREHPRLIIVSKWRGRHCAKADPKNRYERKRYPWRKFAAVAGRYDTTQAIDLAGHLAAGKDFYRDQKAPAGRHAAVR